MPEPLAYINSLLVSMIDPDTYTSNRILGILGSNDE